MNRIVCSDKENLPRGAVRGTAGFCYARGRSSGFYAGTLKAQKECMEKALRKAKEIKIIKERNQQPAQNPMPRANNLKIGEARGLLERHLAVNPRLPRKYMVLSATSKYNGTEQPTANLPLQDLRRILLQYNLVR